MPCRGGRRRDAAPCLHAARKAREAQHLRIEGEPVPADADLAVEMIDHWARMERLGLIWQEGRAVFCTVRLWEAADEPAAKWLALSLGRAALAASQEEENKP